MSILPTIVFVVVFASLELPISISKFIAEKDELYHRSMLIHSLRFAMLCASICAVAAIWILPQLPVFNHYHPWTQWLLIVLIPVVAFSSVARGYFMGAQNMGKIAAANVLKRVAQLVLLVLVFLFFFL